MAGERRDEVLERVRAFFTRDFKARAGLGTWRDGYRSVFMDALTYESWDALLSHACAAGSRAVLPVRLATSTDLGGGRHRYIDTRAGGVRDGWVSIAQEMRFIRTHNSGDTV